MLTGRVLSLNVGLPRTVVWNGRPVETGIWKEPVTGRRAVSLTNIDGDRQADLKVHGGPDKAVYVYSAEDLGWWERELGRRVPPGTFGENLTVATTWPLGESRVGDRWQIGSAFFEVAQPRLPCYKLGIRMGDSGFLRRFAQARRLGLYLRVVKLGRIGAGDTLTVVDRANHGITVDLVGRAYLEDHSLAHAMLGAPDLPAEWLEWARRHAA